ncbi:sigma-70 family RNA polymerase sigma factor [Aureliella helgolandensis]|uniref:RNA polymerase sigma-D factor n=1 Tax=Aureliella helgolandensis TaxID=2527968 RepID=A0A518GAF5_9BACT|nr:sigma-70 family RNA polymerase sigma factor [Aureliella helgolandensis]QDV25565.1 RNA polymerase sigma-D factor [Aureliella helgolandensis]
MNEPIQTRNELIEEGQGLVRSLALKVFRSIPMGAELDDLIAYGEVGLAEAARDFDPSRGVQFCTFAYYRVRGAIYDGLAKMTWTSRARYRRLRYERMADETLAAEQEDHTAENQTLEQSGNWFGRVTEKLAVVYLASGGDEAQQQASSIEDTCDTPSQTFLNREAGERLRQLVAELDPVERRVIQSVYFEGFTLQEAANQVGISKSWASRLHAKILDQLAQKLKRLDLHD